MFPARRLPPRLQTPNSWQKLALFWGGVGAERPRRPRAGAWHRAEIARWHRPKSPASTAWTFSLAISGGPPPQKCRLLQTTVQERKCSQVNTVAASTLIEVLSRAQESFKRSADA